MKTHKSLLASMIALILLNGCAIVPVANSSESASLAKPEKFRVQFFDALPDWRIFSK